MCRRRFEVSTTLATAPEEVIDFLMDLTRHRGLHPFLVSATVVDTGTSAEGKWWDWRVEERPAFGPLRYRIRFPARLTRMSTRSMTSVVRAAPGCWLRSTTVARAEGIGCRVDEATEVTAPWPLTGYMTRNALLAHERTFGGLPEALD